MRELVFINPFRYVGQFHILVVFGLVAVGIMATDGDIEYVVFHVKFSLILCMWCDTIKVEFGNVRFPTPPP